MVIGTTYTPSSRLYAALLMPQMTHMTAGAFPPSSTNLEDILTRLAAATSTASKPKGLIRNKC